MSSRRSAHAWTASCRATRSALAVPRVSCRKPTASATPCHPRRCRRSRAHGTRRCYKSMRPSAPAPLMAAAATLAEPAMSSRSRGPARGALWTSRHSLLRLLAAAPQPRPSGAARAIGRTCACLSSRLVARASTAARRARATRPRRTRPALGSRASPARLRTWRARRLRARKPRSASEDRVQRLVEERLGRARSSRKGAK